MDHLPSKIEKALKDTELNFNGIELFTHPVIKGLVAFITGNPLITYPAMDIITKTVVDMKKQKELIFFTDLNNNSSLLQEGLLSSNEFIQKFLITNKAVLETSRYEKITFFAQLLASSSSNDNFLPMDQYEELVKILHDMSYMEIKMLTLLDSFESNVKGYNKKKPEDKYEGAKVFWGNFYGQLAELVTKDDVISRLNRLQRTGLYEKFGIYTIDGIGAVGDDIPDGFLTSLYYKLKEYTFKEIEP